MNAALRTVGLLLRLRARVARRALRENPGALMGTAIAAFVFGPASLAAAAEMARTLARLPPERAAGFLALSLLALQGVWLLLHLLPGGVATLGRPVPTALLKSLPVRPAVAVTAGALGSLMDLPVLFAVPVLFVAACYGFAGGPTAAALTLLVLPLLLLQTAAIGQVAEQAAALLARRKRPYSWAVLAAGLAFGIYFGLPPAIAASVDSPRLPVVAPNAPIPAAPEPPVFVAALPAAFAANGIRAARSDAFLPAILNAALLLLSVGLTLAAASQLLQVAWTREASAGRATRAPAVASRAGSLARATTWGQVWAVAAHEWRCLTRNPGAHLTLRSPASLLLTVAVAWMAPDLGRDALRNMWDLLGMGAILYAALWQVQILCNRFGNDAGTGALLFGLPVSRVRLIAGRNLALGALLLLVDVPVAVGLCLVAQKPHLIPVFVGWLPVILLALTALGNVVSVASPFPIPKRGSRLSREPERSLAFVYVVLGFAAWAVGIVPVNALLGAGVAVGVVTSAVYLTGLYAGCLYLSARILARREPEIVRRLDRS